MNFYKRLCYVKRKNNPTIQWNKVKFNYDFHPNEFRSLKEVVL